MTIGRPEFPGNSYKERFDPEAKPPAEEVPEKKVVGKVVTGRVLRKKKGLLDKFTETFFGESTESVGQYILFDVLIPAAKDTIVEMVKSGVEMLVFGDTYRPGSRRDQSRTKVSYNNLFKGDRDRERTLSSRTRSSHKFDELTYESRGEAEDVLETLVELIDRYGQATVSDLYEASNVTSLDWADQKWGWENLASAKLARNREGYILVLPKAEPLT